MRIIRWLLVPVAAITAWGLALVVGVCLESLATGLCPESQMVSGACVAPWWPYASTVVLCISAAFAAAMVVLATSLTAPSHRRTVGALVFAAGAAFAVVLAVAGDAYAALPAAAIGGGLALRWVRRRFPA